MIEPLASVDEELRRIGFQVVRERDLLRARRGHETIEVKVVEHGGAERFCWRAAYDSTGFAAAGFTESGRTALGWAMRAVSQLRCGELQESG